MWGGINIMDGSHFNKSFRLKTEKAIEIINLYENTHSEVAKLSLLLANSHLPQPPPRQNKAMEEVKWHKMQFLPQQSKVIYLSLHRLNPHERYLLKLIFRQFSGKQIVFGLSSKPEIVAKDECSFIVRNEKIIKIPTSFGINRELFITFHSSELVFFRFKFEFIKEGNEKQLPERALSEDRRSFYNLPRIESRPLYGQAKTQRSNVSLQTRSRQKSPRIQTFEEAIRGRLKSISHQKLKVAHAQGKKQDLNAYNEKSRQLREVSRRCRGLLDQYEQFCQEHSKKTEVIYKSAALLIFVSKFAWRVSVMVEDHTEKLKDAAHQRSVVRRFAARLMKINRHLKQVSPDPIVRELTTVRSLVQLEVRSILGESRKRAGGILMDCLGRVGPAALVNKALGKSAEFRVKVRTIQKYWQERNGSQVASFEEYINHQIKDLLGKHPHFAPFFHAFYQGRTGRALSWQYLKEASLKLKSIFGGYHVRLAEIEEMRQANQLIRSFNQRALKKHQKPELQIPKAPSYPVTRYFRDISHLKSMTRTWFEIEYRKMLKNSQQKKSKSTNKATTHSKK